MLPNHHGSYGYINNQDLGSNEETLSNNSQQNSQVVYLCPANSYNSQMAYPYAFIPCYPQVQSDGLNQSQVSSEEIKIKGKINLSLLLIRQDLKFHQMEWLIYNQIKITIIANI